MAHELDTGTFPWELEKELLSRDNDFLKSFYSLTGQSRKTFIIQMAEAEAEWIKRIGSAKAEAIQKIRTAEAEGLRAIATAIAESPDKDAIVRLAGLTAVVNVAQSLGEGQATKIFVPHDLGAIFSLLGTIRDAFVSNVENNSATIKNHP